jgi:hypothetical protein
MGTLKIPLNEILEGKHPQYSTNRLKHRLWKEGLLEKKCSICGTKDEWQGKKLVHVLDHINGISDDHRLENLRLLCPNCNSQTDTFCGKNATGKRVPITDKELIDGMKKSYSISDTLRNLNIVHNAHHYGRCKKLIEKYNIIFLKREREYRRKLKPKICLCCGKQFQPVDSSRIFCSHECSQKSQQKIKWPSVSVLKKLVEQTSYVEVGRRLGVSDNAVRKRIRNHG